MTQRTDAQTIDADLKGYIRQEVLQEAARIYVRRALMGHRDLNDEIPGLKRRWALAQHLLNFISDPDSAPSVADPLDEPISTFLQQKLQERFGQETGQPYAENQSTRAAFIKWWSAKRQQAVKRAMQSDNGVITDPSDFVQRGWADEHLLAAGLPLSPPPGVQDSQWERSHEPNEWLDMEGNVITDEEDEQ